MELQIIFISQQVYFKLQRLRLDFLQISSHFYTFLMSLCLHFHSISGNTCKRMFSVTLSCDGIANYSNFYKSLFQTAKDFLKWLKALWSLTILHLFPFWEIEYFHGIAFLSLNKVLSLFTEFQGNCSGGVEVHECLISLQHESVCIVVWSIL